MIDFGGLLKTLADGDVHFILIGGVAAMVHGAARLTQDVDIVYERSSQNYERLAAALEPHKPYLRDAPPGLPFQLTPTTLERGLNFTLTTSLGPLDLLGEIVGGGTYQDLLPHTFDIEAFGVSCRCLTLAELIRVKRAAGRPKDLEAIAELEAILGASSEE